MANVDLKRKDSNNSKKTYSVATGVVDISETGTLAIADTVVPFNIPGGSVITNAYIVVNEAVAGATGKVNISVNGTVVLAAVVLGATPGVVGGAVTKKFVEDNVDCISTISVANLTAGKFTIVVEFSEVGLKNGKLLDI